MKISPVSMLLRWIIWWKGVSHKIKEFKTLNSMQETVMKTRFLIKLWGGNAAKPAIHHCEGQRGKTDRFWLLQIDVALLLLQEIQNLNHILSWHVEHCKDHKKWWGQITVTRKVVFFKIKSPLKQWDVSSVDPVYLTEGENHHYIFSLIINTLGSSCFSP